MKKIIVLITVATVLLLQSCEQKQLVDWKAAPNPLMTKWSAGIDPSMPWPEYPRPQMQRNEWINLNGLWDYQLNRQKSMPETYTRKILVPFPVESSLSGVADSVGPDDVIWYRREFSLPTEWKDKQVLLHFEAVDWETRVFVNGVEAGSHRGGYDPFSFNISPHIDHSGSNELVIQVTDPTNEGFQARGKQVLKPGGIWYTPSSGIWQTVWLESVHESGIEDLYLTPKPSDGYLEITVKAKNFLQGDRLVITILEQDSMLAQESFSHPEGIKMMIENIHWWSPSDPYLYDLKLQLMRGEEILDEVFSYFGMREIKKRRDGDGFMRLALNGEVSFHNGPLDQGFWPDGLYTPPSDEAMKFDIMVTKAMGFNMLRKHVKVENRRFYYWCDKLGIMVWQDMPSTSGYVAPDKPDLDRPDKEKQQFMLELERLVKTKYNHPSIVMWIPFNEGWGQFDTEEIVEFIYGLDASRLVNNTSGWADRGVGDVIDIHHYPDPRCPEPESDRASVLGEFGGPGLYIEGHSWEQKNWGYQKMNDSVSLLLKYEQFYTTVWEMMHANGLAAAVYTQTTDVETETNGLITYDRKVIKMDTATLKRINTNNYVPAPRFEDEESEGIFNNSKVVVIVPLAGETYYTLDGSVPTMQSNVYQAPFKIENSTLIRAASFKNDKRSLVVEKEFTKTEKRPPVYQKPFDQRYAGGGIFALIDGKYGGLDFADGKWQGYRDNELDVVFDLGGRRKIKGVAANFLINHKRWIFLPETFRVYASDDMKEYTLLEEIVTVLDTGFSEPTTKTIRVEKPDIYARYIRVTANTIGPIPEWHESAKGRPSWLFIDEIVIE
ncbi:MAG: glycoside hydrolase family 2 TIM barrel-domain containing protein [Bacteroidales bacterium]|nr:glycoside hydrolase family 2 TIM barrel-domain containing protein [Bacteroidales bacterium]